MKILSATFIKSCTNVSQLPSDGLPQIAFCGRSNCGKSSLLNVLTSRRGLAKVSRTPGRTQLINLFLINEKFYFVDLPGFGFARVTRKKKEELGEMITAYVQQAPELIGMVSLLDIRHKPSVQDRIMDEFLIEEEIPVLHVATKSDKVGSSKREKHLKIIRETLKLEKSNPIIKVSSLKYTGIKELLRAIDENFVRPDLEVS
ncbi:MAG: ribosome biogenesis GTP-binding protein YihA/YsxC [Planctomycetota bacterium]|nr:ribosome biogenesis GTP-binding protein YihA/YsxC [Planctomycetota bacterium]